MRLENRQVNLFCAGDSGDIDTWSNFPYFLSRALIRKGIKVHRINIIPTEDFRYRIYMYFFQRWDGVVKRLCGTELIYDFFRDRVGGYLARQKIRREAKRAAAADLNIFLTFSFSSCRDVPTPVVHLSDITYQQYLEESGKKIGKRERRFIQNEMEILPLARVVAGISERCCDFLRSRYRLTNVRKLSPGINLDVEETRDIEQLLSRKWNAKSILFIGRGIHKRGADILLRAFALFNQRNENAYVLNIVGATREELGTDSDKVTCYGYLSKEIPEERSRYLELLRTATVFAMPMREGPFPGVIREALLFYTPVIVSNIWNEEQKIRHGYNGITVEPIEPEAFARELNLLLEDRQKWERMAKNAHESVRSFSWDRTVTELLEAVIGANTDSPVAAAR